ncbi:hypothetical protein BofuT4_uP038530.1 [Botrytis cinerea T4]|uniref:Uncharacterized protein n=1 Tax=Botryotinia fuckeliana (strain T4) TaxID=999810 RepID=G2Y2R1_BOTF4|nr:hypothetical protein BofuT4_uP038530.1 [Botrytis cinerea T4]
MHQQGTTTNSLIICSYIQYQYHTHFHQTISSHSLTQKKKTPHSTSSHPPIR